MVRGRTTQLLKEDRLSIFGQTFLCLMLFMLIVFGSLFSFARNDVANPDWAPLGASEIYLENNEEINYAPGDTYIVTFVFPDGTTEDVGVLHGDNIALPPKVPVSFGQLVVYSKSLKNITESMTVEISVGVNYMDWILVGVLGLVAITFLFEMLMFKRERKDKKEKGQKPKKEKAVKAKKDKETKAPAEEGALDEETGAPQEDAKPAEIGAGAAALAATLDANKPKPAPAPQEDEEFDGIEQQVQPDAYNDYNQNAQDYDQDSQGYDQNANYGQSAQSYDNNYYQSAPQTMDYGQQQYEQNNVDPYHSNNYNQGYDQNAQSYDQAPTQDYSSVYQEQPQAYNEPSMSYDAPTPVALEVEEEPEEEPVTIAPAPKYEPVASTFSDVDDEEEDGDKGEDFGYKPSASDIPWEDVSAQAEPEASKPDVSKIEPLYSWDDASEPEEAPAPKSAPNREIEFTPLPIASEESKEEPKPKVPEKVSPIEEPNYDVEDFDKFDDASDYEYTPKAGKANAHSLISNFEEDMDEIETNSDLYHSPKPKPTEKSVNTNYGAEFKALSERFKKVADKLDSSNGKPSSKPPTTRTKPKTATKKPTAKPKPSAPDEEPASAKPTSKATAVRAVQQEMDMAPMETQTYVPTQTEVPVAPPAALAPAQPAPVALAPAPAQPAALAPSAPPQPKLPIVPKKPTLPKL